MISTTLFFIWFFSGLGGIGGWLIFFLISAAAVFYVFINSSMRKLPALGWRLGVLFLALLVLPAAIFRFLSPGTQITLVQYLEILFYMGIIGGIVPFFMALGYYLRFRGMVLCANGHLFDSILGECPECVPTTIHDEDRGSNGLITEIADERDFIKTQFGKISLPKKNKLKAQAFLLLPDKHHYQLNKGTSEIGRQMENDFVFDNPYVGRRHAKIVQEKENLFRLYDLGTKNGTWLNGRRLNQPVLLEADDEIRLGTEVKVVFLTKGRL
jgi:hypothetical protein